MSYAGAMSGVSAGYYERKDRYNQRSVKTDIYINKTLEIINEKSTKLFRVCHVVNSINDLVQERGMTEKQAAEHIRKAVEYWKKSKGDKKMCNFMSYKLFCRLEGISPSHLTSLTKFFIFVNKEKQK